MSIGRAAVGAGCVVREAGAGLGSGRTPATPPPGPAARIHEPAPPARAVAGRPLARYGAGAGRRQAGPALGRPELGRLYERLVDELELVERSAALDRKRTLIGEATTTMLSLVEARRSLVLEVAIVVLILVEVRNTLYEKLAG